MRNQECITQEQCDHVISFKDSKNKKIQQSAKSFLNTARDVIGDKVSSKFKLHVREGEINPVLNQSSNNKT